VRAVDAETAASAVYKQFNGLMKKVHIFPKNNLFMEN
jgi:hypothetical protein